MDIIDRKNCPICGTPVVIVTDGTTSHYKPMYKEEVRLLNEMLAKQTIVHGEEYTKILEENTLLKTELMNIKKRKNHG